MDESLKLRIEANCASITKEELALALFDVLDCMSAHHLSEESGIPLDRACEIMAIFDKLVV